jgi:uncharacterized protein
MNIFKKIFLFTYFFVGCIVLFAQDIPIRPNPPRLVNDFTNTLTADQIQTLETKLVSLDNNTSTQIAVVLVPSTNGTTIADYNLELLRKWQVGSKANNNGIVLLVAKKDRKLDISVGYGLEGSLSDATAKSIIDDIIVPHFKGDDYYRGIDLGINSIVQAVQGKYNIKRETNKSGGGSSMLFFIIVLLIIFFILSRRGGGGGGIFMSRRGQRGIADAIFWNTILNSGGGGGGWSGGGGGGGGFGGFGGGSGGGGGASGSW